MAERIVTPSPQPPSLPRVVFDDDVSASLLPSPSTTFPAPVEIGTDNAPRAEIGADSPRPRKVVSFEGRTAFPNQPIVEGILPYPTVATDPFSQIYPSASDKFKTAGAHAVTSAIESAPMTAGIATGMALGIPGGPPGILAGAIIGGVGGYLFGQKVVSPIVQEMAQDPAFLGGYARDPDRKSVV